jgi:hypothetical protein
MFLNETHIQKNLLKMVQYFMGGNIKVDNNIPFFVAQMEHLLMNKTSKEWCKS